MDLHITRPGWLMLLASSRTGCCTWGGVLCEVSDHTWYHLHWFLQQLSQVEGEAAGPHYMSVTWFGPLCCCSAWNGWRPRQSFPEDDLPWVFLFTCYSVGSMLVVCLSWYSCANFSDAYWKSLFDITVLGIPCCVIMLFVLAITSSDKSIQSGKQALPTWAVPEGWFV